MHEGLKWFRSSVDLMQNAPGQRGGTLLYMYSVVKGFPLLTPYQDCRSIYVYIIRSCMYAQSSSLHITSVPRRVIHVGAQAVDES